MKTKTIRVALVDDQKLFRRGLRMILEGRPGLEITLEAENGNELLAHLISQTVDVVLLDVEMPEMDGMATLNRLRELKLPVRVVMLSMHDSPRLIAHFMEQGADGYLLKDEEPETVYQAIKEVMEKGTFFRQYVSEALLRQSRDRAQKPPTPPGRRLSDREREVLKLICEELTSKEIAGRLFLSPRTVEGHRRRIMEKTGARNTAGLIRYALKQGII